MILRDPASERAVLAGICQYGKDALADVEDLINANSFVDSSASVLFKCLKHIFDKDPKTTVDISSIYAAAHELLGSTTFYENKEQREYLRIVMNTPVNLENVRKFAAKLMKLDITRQFYECVSDIREKLPEVTGSESVDTIIGIVEGPLYDLTAKLSKADNVVSDFGDGVLEYIKHIEENPRQLMGLSTGYPLYDRAIGGGLRRKTVNVIAARPKTGKSMWTDNVGLYLANVVGVPVLNLDTEMSKEDHWHRMLANLSNVPTNDIESGKYAKYPKQKEAVRKAAASLSHGRYHYASIAGKPFAEITAIIRRWVNKYVGHDENGRTKDCLIMYDYLKMMDSAEISKNMQEYQILGFQMTALHNLCVHLDIPCLMFLQLNREEMASGSDRIVWLCSNFSTFKRKTEQEIVEDGAENGDRKLVVEFCRHGEGIADGDYINMNSNFRYARLLEGKTRFSLLQNKKQEKDSFEVEDDNDGEFEG